MSEMVERVARAMARNINEFQIETGFAFEIDFKDGIDADWAEYIPTAKAAIAALREPTEAMLNAARDWSDRKYGKPIGNDAATGCFRAMIDKALE